MPKYYLLDENKNLVEGYDKEGFLALLEEAIENGDLEHIDENSAVVSKLKSVLNGTTHNIEFVTQAQYNQLVQDEELVPNTYYFITDDTTLEGLEERINNIINGTQIVGKAINADHATEAEYAETIAQQLYMHEIWIKNSSTYVVSFRLFTNDNHKTIAKNISAIKSVIEDIYGYDIKIPASGSYTHMKTVASQAYTIISTVNSVQLISSNFRAWCQIMGEINTGEAEVVNLEDATTIEIKTIRLI